MVERTEELKEVRAPYKELGFTAGHLKKVLAGDEVA